MMYAIQSNISFSPASRRLLKKNILKVKAESVLCFWGCGEVGFVAFYCKVRTFHSAGHFLKYA